MKKKLTFIILCCLPLLAWAQNINFADPKVEALCVDNWDTNHDGKLSRAEAAAVTDLGEVFEGKKEISSFNELRFFTGLTEIARSAFSDCENLVLITFPSNIQKICEWAFSNTSFTSLSIPDHIKEVESHSFYGCKQLTTLTIGSGLSAIGWDAFGTCPALIQIVVSEKNPTFDSRDESNCVIETETNALIIGCKNSIIPSSVTDIAEVAFGGCWNLDFINIPMSVKVIEAGAFAWAMALENLIIPSSVETIGDEAFSFIDLQHIFIPSSVTTFGDRVFKGSGMSLKSVTVEWTQPLAIPANTFEEVPLENVTLYVPAGTKNAYQNAEVWRDFGEIVELGNDMADIGENVYYLKNVETGKYLSNGNAWGMHAVLADREEALPVRIHKREGNYMLYCPERSQFLQYIFRDDETNVFVDYNGQDYASPYWTFITQGKDIYYIQTEPGHPVYGQEAMPGTCLGNNPDDGTDVNGNVGMGEHRNNVLWQLELARKTGEQHNRLEELANTAEPLGVDVGWAREILKWDEADYFDAMWEITRKEKDLGRIDQLKGELRNMIASAGKIGVDTEDASSVADNYGSTIDAIRQAISDLRSAFIAKLGEGIDENLLPLDVTGVIVNPSFIYDNAEGWEGDEPRFEPHRFCNNAEFYGRSFDFHQTISGLPNGEYRLDVTRFKRGVDDEHVHYYANDGLCNVSDVYEEAQDRILSYGCNDYGYPDFQEYEVDGTIKYVPNSMTGARLAFDAGLYGSWLPFEVTDGTATIGIKVDTEEGERWVCFDDFRLTYCGDEPANLFAESDISSMDDAIYVERGITAHIGMDVDIEVKLKNAQTASSYGFDLVLPEGITIADDDNGSINAAITRSPRNGTHSVTSKKIADNIYRIYVNSLKAKSLSGNDGTVLTIKAHVQDDMPGGDLYRIVIRRPEIVYSDDTQPEVQKTITRVNVIDFDNGDANGDGKVNLTDVQVVIKHYVGKPVAKFIEWKADVDGDGIIDLADAIRILNYLIGNIPTLSRGVDEASSSVLRESARNALTVADFGLSPKGGNINVNLTLDAADVYTGYQFKVETPEGLSYVVDSDDDVECELGEGHADHEAIAHWNEDERLLAVGVVSTNLSTFSGQSLSLQIPLAATTLPVGSTADFKITGVTLIKQGGEKTRIGDAVFKVTIGEKGDVNGDGDVDGDDVAALADYIIGVGTLANEAAADVNGDTKIDIQDVTALIGIVTQP